MIHQHICSSWVSAAFSQPLQLVLVLQAGNVVTRLLMPTCDKACTNVPLILLLLLLLLVHL
jgi:hypothetical protein